MQNNVPGAVPEAAAWLTVAATAMMPSIDGDALVGAFCGAAIYTLRSAEAGLLRRAAYMLLSLVAGYAFAGNLHAALPILGTGPAALAISMLLVTAGGTVLEWVRTLDISGLLARFFGRG